MSATARPWHLRRVPGGLVYFHIGSAERERIAVVATEEDAKLILESVNGVESKPDQEIAQTVTSCCPHSDRCCEILQDHEQLRWALRGLIDKPTDPECINMARLALGVTT